MRITRWFVGFVIALTVLMPGNAHAQAVPQPCSAPEPITRPYLTKFCGDILPDGTVFHAGDTVRDVWKLRNDGTQPWVNFTVDMVYGSAFNTTFPESISINQVVNPGDEIEIPIEFPAPDQPRNYIGVYMVTTPDGLSFIRTFWVAITVT